MTGDVPTHAERPPDRAGLRRELTGRQVGMIAIGGAIGTGLFLGSGLAISLAGPAVIVAYLVAALAALVVAYTLAEMTVVHPEAGGFGAIAHRYLGPAAGFVQRWIYWTAQVVNVGSEVVAAGLYVRFWWPQLPLWLPVVVFSVVMLAVNALSVRFFGEFEYWFAMIKVVTIVVFVLLGVLAVTVGLPGRPAAGLSALTEHGGFAPNGMTGVWLAMTVVTFSYMGTEAVAVTAAESRNPARDLPRAARRMVLRLALFYVLGMAVVVSIVPWRDAASSEGLQSSPFVRLFSAAGVPAAAGLMNFVILTAALSAMNTNLYVTARMAHSLARDGYAPRWMGRVNQRGVPRNALALSATGLVLAAVVSVTAPESAFPVMLGIALFGALVTWLIIFATHAAFRRHRASAGLPSSPIRLPGAPVTTALAALFILGVLVTTAFTQQFGLAWKAGLPYLALLALAYVVVRRFRKTPTAPTATSDSTGTNASR
ncbi:amino acid permease [Streptoalloteichus hindustanus]|uniref:Amino acid/polyamine/organocation transporter, APC superfamily n=1 Tax=Streptoalloteichus hindustanus TaxID=2017 RepID=A0A1M5AFU2_STRHI|nr:amino acid permease [Streptoalloteichus hindustanus]SHF28986.1 amino acid/polyamine/organocation transporter, APC superfamily [Streptoalloteichus hindustanus]